MLYLLHLSLCSILLVIFSWHSSSSIVNGCGLGDWSSIPCRGKGYFPLNLDKLWGSPACYPIRIVDYLLWHDAAGM